MKPNNLTTKMKKEIRHIKKTNLLEKIKDLAVNGRGETTKYNSHSTEEYSSKKGNLLIFYKNDSIENEGYINVFHDKNFVLNAQKSENFSSPKYVKGYEIKFYDQGEKTWEKEVNEKIKKEEKDITFIPSYKKSLGEKISNCFS